MTDQDYGADTMRMIRLLVYLEKAVAAASSGTELTADLNDDINFGREILDRNLMKTFFGGGPKGMNRRARAKLLQLLLRIEKEEPDLFTAKVSKLLLEELRIYMSDAA